MVLNQDFKEFIQSLNSHNVKYLIIGGYALAVHGIPRYTKDLDVWVLNNTENAEKLLKALSAFGFGSLGLKTADFTAVDQIVQLGYPPNRIDILCNAVGVQFETCYERRITLNLDGIQCAFLSLEDLKANKKATGRLQDLADLEKLQSLERND